VKPPLKVSCLLSAHVVVVVKNYNPGKKIRKEAKVRAGSATYQVQRTKDLFSSIYLWLGPMCVDGVNGQADKLNFAAICNGREFDDRVEWHFQVRQFTCGKT